MQRLNGTWRIASDPENVGRERRWFEKVQDGAQDAPVPGCIQEVIPRHHGVAWYWTEATVPPNPHPGGRTLLRFWAVDYLADVWVNGDHVGGHEGGEAPFVLDVDSAVKTGRKNLIAVRVLNPTHEPVDGIRLAETPHTVKNYPLRPGHWCYLNAGGIVDDVELIHSPAHRVDDLYVRPNWETGDVQVEVTIKSFRENAATGLLQLVVAPSMAGAPADTDTIPFDAEPGSTTVAATLHVENRRLWDVDDPYLYRVSARVSEPEWPGSFDEASTRCGFRDFRLEGNHFRLNGRRIFLRSAHVGPEYPVGLLVPRDPKLELLDAAYIKSSGMNCVRYIASMARREVLDVCDEMGIMVYEEHHASWGMAPSPRMGEHYDRQCREMILRDRNHACVTVWGMLNETTGPLVAHARGALSLVRSLDRDRLVAFSSGSWDFRSDPDTGCMSNPGSDEWDVVLGGRAGGKMEAEWDQDANISDMVDPAGGDIHMYPPAPQPLRVVRGLRRMGRGLGPIFVSEYGQGSAIDLSRLVRQYQQAGAGGSEAADMFAATLRMFLRDWDNWDMAAAFGRPEDYFHQAQSRMANLRYEGINALRANPQVIGYSLTALRDVSHTGEGLWTYYRELKPRQMDAVSDAYAPLRWCLFAEPDVIVRDRSVELEAVLANEDVLPPGEYPVRLELFGPDSECVWRRRTVVHVPPGREAAPLAIPVFSGRVRVKGPAGQYRFTATVESGASPRGRPAVFHVEDPATWPEPAPRVVLWGRHCRLRSWLRKRNVEVHDLERGRSRDDVIVVADHALGLSKSEAFPELYRQIQHGAVALFLSPDIFGRADDVGAWLPEGHEDALCSVPSDLYISDNWAKAHPAFDGLPAGGLLDDSVYRDLIPVTAWNGDSEPHEAIAGANRCSLHPGTGYVSGLFLSRHRLGVGSFYLNTFRVLEHLGKNPVAERFLLNLINCAASMARARAADGSHR